MKSLKYCYGKLVKKNKKSYVFIEQNISNRRIP